MSSGTCVLCGHVETGCTKREQRGRQFAAVRGVQVLVCKYCSCCTSCAAHEAVTRVGHACLPVRPSASRVRLHVLPTLIHVV